MVFLSCSKSRSLGPICLPLTYCKQKKTKNQLRECSSCTVFPHAYQTWFMGTVVLQNYVIGIWPQKCCSQTKLYSLYRKMTLATYKCNLYIFIPHHMIVVEYYGFTFDFHVSVPLSVCRRGWLGETKVPCILIALQGIRLILAYSWARPVVLAAGMGKGECFISSVSSL